MQPWKTLRRETVLRYSKFLTIERHVVELPHGEVIDDWPWLVTPDFVNVIAVTPVGRFLCFRQPKYGVDGLTLAPVGGYLEPDEAPLAAAKRELREETGYEAPRWRSLGTYTVDGNRGAGRAHFFLAQEARPVCEPAADDLEEQELQLLTRSQIEAALLNEQFKILPNAAALALALLMLPASGPD